MTTNKIPDQELLDAVSLIPSVKMMIGEPEIKLEVCRVYFAPSREQLYEKVRLATHGDKTIVHVFEVYKKVTQDVTAFFIRMGFNPHPNAPRVW